MRPLISATVVALCLTVLPAASNAQSAPSDPASRTTKGLVVKNNAWGALKLGMTHKQAQKTGMVTTKLDHCAPGYQLAKKFRGRGYIVWQGHFPAMKVQQIIITGKKEHTARKIHVGSTLRQLRAAYPNLSKVSSSGDITGQAQTGDDIYVASVRKPHVGTLNFQFAYGSRPKSSSKINKVVIASGRTVYWGC